MTIRAQQINMSGYYTATQVDSLIPSTVNFATHAEVTSTSGILDSKITNTSGQLNTYISNTSGQLDSRITTNSTNLSNTSGQLDSRISADVSNLTNTSGQLNTRINNSGAYSATISGQLDTRINATGLYAANVSGQLDARITSSGAWVTTVSTNLANTSGQLDARITSSGAYMANVSGQLNTYITNTSGQLDARITSSGAYSVNISGQLDTKITNTSGQLSNRINNLTVATLSGVTITNPVNNQVLTYSNGIWINQSGTGGEGGGVTDHGALTGLDDDDHAAIYYNKTIIDTTSGILNTYISNTSGQLDSRITSDVTNLSNTSGQLNTRINNSGAYSAAVSGQLDARISATGLYAANVSGQLDARITSSGTYAVNTSGQLSNRINNLTLATLSGMAIGTPASGQVISYNGTAWGNSVPAAGGSTAVAFQANRSTAWTHANGAFNIMALDQAWITDDATFYHDYGNGNATVRSKVYINVPGTYAILGQISWGANATNRQIRIQKNGTSVTGSQVGADIGAVNTSGAIVTCGVSGDYFQIATYADNVDENNNQPGGKVRILQLNKFS